MRVSEYVDYDATALAQLIRRGDVSASEVYAVAVAAIKETNDKINAVADGPWEHPLSYAADGPFGGVPFVIKDLGVYPEGVRRRIGTRLSGDGIVLPGESYLMRRFRDAGLAMIATTTTPEFGFNASSEALAYGPTRNPWDLTRSAGGSSGGTAALVAAGAVPIGHGSDGGGSIRIPAAATGLVGLKPSRGRISIGPQYWEGSSGLAAEFAITRSMRDCATLLDAVAGAMPGDKFIVQRPDRPWANEIGADPGRLRIAVHTTSWAGTPVDPEVVAATQAVARQLEQLGHHVEWAAPSFDWDEFVSAMSITMAISAVERADGISKITGRKLDAQSLENTTLALYEYGRTLGASQFVRINEVGNKMARAVGEFFSRWDLLVTPTMNDPSVPLGHLDANDPTLDAAGWVRRIFGACSFTPLFNWTGTPAISLPLGWSSGGLPIGVQLAAPMCDDAVLMRVGSQLEQAMPWKSRRPTTLAGSGRSKP